MPRYTIDNSNNPEELCFCVNKNSSQKDIIETVKKLVPKKKKYTVETGYDYESGYLNDFIKTDHEDEFEDKTINVKPKGYDRYFHSYSQEEPDKIQAIDEKIQKELVNVTRDLKMTDDEYLNVKPYETTHVSKHDDTEFGVLTNNYAPALEKKDIFEGFGCNSYCSNSNNSFFNDKETKYIILVILVLIISSFIFKK